MPIDGISFCPPLVITEDEVNLLFDKVESVMPEIESMAAALR